jgi:hypothetical protein
MTLEMGEKNVSAIDKLRIKFYSKPIRNDMTFDEIAVLAESYGCIICPGSNHMKVVSKETGRVIPIPRHGKCVGEAYIKQLRDMFNEIQLILEGR